MTTKEAALLSCAINCSTPNDEMVEIMSILDSVAGNETNATWHRLKSNRQLFIRELRRTIGLQAPVRVEPEPKT